MRHRVLYIEDNADSRRLMERIAELHGGLDLVTATTRPARASTRARASHARTPILLDLHLPDGSGDDVMRWLQEDPATAGHPGDRPHRRCDAQAAAASSPPPGRWPTSPSPLISRSCSRRWNWPWNAR